MDDEGDNGTHHHSVTTDDIEVSGKKESEDNSTGDHTVVVDPDQLIGPQVIDIIMNKPEFSFLIRYYSLLYQSLIPNCKLTLHTLCQHISISDNIEQYIVGAASHRTSCQRLINFLITRLYSEKDYIQFCNLLNIISVMTDLPYKLISEFRANGNWDCNVPDDARPLLHKSQADDCNISEHDLHNTNIKSINIKAESLSALSSVYQVNCACSTVENSTLQCCVHDGASDDRAEKCSISGYYHHRKRQLALHTATTDKQCLTFHQGIHKSNAEKFPISLTLNANTMDISFLLCLSDWRVVEEYFKLLCSVLPQNNQLTIDKLKTIPQFLKDEGEQLSKIISSSSADVRKINEKIITYLIVKLCYNESDTSLVRLCDVMDESNDTHTYAIASHIPRTEEYEVPEILQTNKDFTELKAHYHTILRLMPDDYELSVGKLLNYISDDQICNILSSSSSIIANKTILDCLIKRMRCREDLLDLCDQLEKIIASHDIEIVISEIRLGVQQSIQFPISTAVTTNTQSLSSTDQQPNDSKFSMQEILRYKDRRLHKGFKYQRPPPLPSNHVNRQILLDEIATKLLQASVDPDKYETTLTITGAGGFGKTITAISLCHHPLIKKQFTDGFVFIELGPQATDPCIKLRAIYDLLTNEQCDINIVEQKTNQLISDYFRNLLVIIDDVWHVEDAEPLVKAFANCKTILTTRMNNIEQYIPSKHSVTAGPMTEAEAISLLTTGVIDSSQLSQEDVSLLHEISQDVHLWPLLLSLIRGQLSHNLKQYHLPYNKAIQNVQAKLHHKGLAAFDKNNIESVKKGRNLAVKACIEITLELLTKSSTDKLKALILYSGIGISLQTAVLNNLWNISKQEAEDTVDVLWAYGLLQFTHVTISPNNIKQHCVEVHAVISQYIIENTGSKELYNLAPFGGKLGTAQSVSEGLVWLFLQSYGVHDPSLLAPMQYLEYRLSEIESVKLPFHLKAICMFTATDPHIIILSLQDIKYALSASPYTITLLSLIDEKINEINTNCEETLKDTRKLCRKLNQSVQRNLYEQKYDKLIETVKVFMRNYPVCNIAQKAVTMIKMILPYCDGKLLNYLMIRCERLQMLTFDYHSITILSLPSINLLCKLHNQITNSLLNRSPDIYYYMMSGKYDEEEELVRDNYLIKVAPNPVHKLASQ